MEKTEYCDKIVVTPDTVVTILFLSYFLAELEEFLMFECQDCVTHQF